MVINELTNLHMLLSLPTAYDDHSILANLHCTSVARDIHRMVWVGRELEDHLVPTPLP